MIDGGNTRRAGFANETGAIVLEDSAVLNTYSTGHGGSFLVYDDASLTVRRTRFDTSTADQGVGGFITISCGFTPCPVTPTLLVEGCSFRNGRSIGATDSGGIYCNTPGTCTISDSLFVGNQADSDGGAIAGESASIITVTNSRFCQNTAGRSATTARL